MTSSFTCEPLPSRPAGVARPRAGAKSAVACCLLLAACTPPSQHDHAASIAPVQGAAVENTWQATPTALAAAAPLEPEEKPSGGARTTAADKVRQLAAGIASELAERCPLRDPGDQASFDACRKAMFDGSKIRSSLGTFTLWGRQNKDPEKLLKETNLTQFGPDVLTGMYLPLFMFTGKSSISYSAKERLYRVELGARFRNRLQPGQFPYPFWHEDEKWKTYEDANAILLWVDPRQSVVRVAQFTAQGTLTPSAPNTPVAHRPFDGRWMWTDAGGQQQPKVTLFDGLFRADNPHLKKLDASYRALALSLREGQCTACHVPNNPNKMKRLVLLQTPAHAAGEIKRVMAAVRRGSMPLSEFSGVEEPLAEPLKGDLLRRAAAFETVVDAAKAWEAARSGKPAPPNAPNRSDKSATSEAIR